MNRRHSLKLIAGATAAVATSGLIGPGRAFAQTAPAAPAGPFKLPPESRALSEAMRLSWTAFAASGNPSNKRIPKWPRASEGIQRLHPMLSVASLEDFSTRHKCASD